MDMVATKEFDYVKQGTGSTLRTPNACIHSLISRHYHERPFQVALSATDRDVTYEDLGKQSAIVTVALQARGVKAGDPVGVCLPKSTTAVVYILGILRAGAAWVAMDPANPRERNHSVMCQAGVRFIIAERESTLVTSLNGVTLVDPAELDNWLAPQEWNREKFEDPDSVAYMMFTSGSTGQPKGVVHKHHAVAGSLSEVVPAFGLDRHTRFFQFSSFAFDASICELFAPLVAGGTVCIPRQEELAIPSDLDLVMRRLRVTDASLPPVIAEAHDPRSVPCLKHLYIGGAPPTPEVLARWCSKVRLSNIYGTTETGVWDSIKLDMDIEDDPKDIGRGLGVTFWVVHPDNVDLLQQNGTDGELLLQSPYMAEGYLNAPEQQSRAFIEPPQWAPRFTDSSTSGRFYRTGDIAQRTEDGSAILRGRKSGFTKIHGLRIELDEVQRCIDSVLPPGKRSAVIASEPVDDGKEPEIVAFLEHDQPGSDARLADTMSGDLARLLPYYMIPTVFIPIHSVPLTNSKKIDKTDLQKTFARLNAREVVEFRKGGAGAMQQHIEPERRVAMEVSHIIAEMIRNKGDSLAEELRGKNFALLSIGLDSVQLIYFIGVIKRRWGIAITMSQLRLPGVTICDIEQYIITSQGKLSASPHNARRDLRDDLVALRRVIPSPAVVGTKRVFCTAITGFFGSHLLQALLACPEVGCVVGLVRAENEVQAREKVRQQARIGRWWRDDYNPRIEIWLGDLSLPRLGLTPERWDCLTGSAGRRMDAVIHNGARVNWLDGYDKLKAANVESTLEILRALSCCTHRTVCPLTYISGGYLPCPGESLQETAGRLSTASAYDQTKFLSRWMIEEYNAQLDRQNAVSVPRALVVQPGFMVGTQSEGVAQTEDFLWRLAFAILRIGAIGESLERAYFPVAGVDQIAGLTVQTALSWSRRGPGPFEHTVYCRDGLYLSDLCHILEAKTGITIGRMEYDAWLEAVRADTTCSSGLDNGHPFRPILELFERDPWQLMATTPEPSSCNVDATGIFAAVERSVEYLIEVGYLPQCSRPASEEARRSIPLFRRSPQ